MSVQLHGQAHRGAFVLDVDLDIDGGETIAVIGANGAGKSSMFRVIAGIERLDQGTATVMNQLVDDPANKLWVPADERPVTLQLQDGMLFPHLSVLDNVAFGFRSRRSGPKIGKAAARQRAHTLLERFGITDLATQKPPSLSGGQSQRVALARSLSAAPGVLLLDEPSAALDATARVEIRRHLARLPMTTLIITHDPVEARLLADRVAVMDDGKVVQLATVDQAMADPATSWLADFLGLNLLAGVAAGTEVTLENGTVAICAQAAQGPVYVSFTSSAVTLHPERPSGSARNVWEVTVQELHPGTDPDQPNRVRVLFDGPVTGTADVTAGSVRALGLIPGARCWASVKATELSVRPR